MYLTESPGIDQLIFKRNKGIVTEQRESFQQVILKQLNIHMHFLGVGGE